MYNNTETHTNEGWEFQYACIDILVSGRFVRVTDYSLVPYPHLHERFEFLSPLRLHLGTQPPQPHLQVSKL